MRPLLLAASSLGLVAVMAGCGDDDATADPAGGCRTVTVSIGEFTFEPTPVRVHACDRVVWANTHDQAHTSTGKGDQSWNTGNVEPGTTSEPVTFDHAGTFPYICALHPFMHGEVDVT